MSGPRKSCINYYKNENWFDVYIKEGWLSSAGINGRVEFCLDTRMTCTKPDTLLGIGLWGGEVEVKDTLKRSQGVNSSRLPVPSVLSPCELLISFRRRAHSKG